MFFGVATAGFQIEGGYNGHGEPRNNWARFEDEGRVEPSGLALDFWNRYEEQLDRVAALGCDSFRLSIEWARCEPEEGRWDDRALERYRSILDACHDRGLTPLVTLSHFTWPQWVGEGLWLDLTGPERYARWAARAAAEFAPQVQHWVTLNEINILALQTYLTGEFPPAKRLAVGSVVRSMDHQLTAHVLGYEAIKAVRPDAVISTNNYSFSLYELDRLLQDVLVARLHGIPRHGLHDWLVQRKREFEARVTPASGPEPLLRRWAAAAIPLERAFPRAVDAVYRCPHECTLDVIQVDHYDPVVRHHLRVPGHRTAGGRNWLPGRMLWDDPPDPDGFELYTDLHTEPGREVWVVENGLCNRVRNGRSFPRLDGWTRPRYLTAHLDRLRRMAEGGMPVGGYWHWCLADNYEWGSYEPRFGLFGVDRERGIRWSEEDAIGEDAAGAYRAAIAAWRRDG